MALSDCLIARCRQTLLVLGAVVAIAGCALQGPQTSADTRTSEPGAGPVRTGADYAGLRRCMDNLLLDYGMRDVSVIVDELADSSQRDDAGTRDMLIAAVSDMTQRSRAIRLVASDNDWRPTRSQSQLAGGGSAQMAQYALRGTLHAQAGDNAGTTVLALDLTLLTTQNMSVVPGTASRNVATLIAPTPGREGRVELHKFGVDFSLPIGGDSAREGRAVATRALLDVAAIEIFGRVAKVPYWSCFGASADQAPVVAEIQDWYDTMAVHPAELIGYFQQQLRTRGLYDGPIDGNVNPSLKNAVVRYRAALGLSREPKLSLEFFQVYLAADHRELQSRLHAPAGAATLAAATSALSTPANPSVAPLAVWVAATNGAKRFARGEPVQLTVRPSRDAFVYCFHQDENRKIMRFFPNRFQRDPRVASAAGVQLPGAMRFEIVLNPRGVTERVACFATDSDVLAQLPATVNASDFAPLAVASLDQVRSAFVKVSGGTLAQESFQIQPR